MHHKAVGLELSYFPKEICKARIWHETTQRSMIPTL